MSLLFPHINSQLFRRSSFGVRLRGEKLFQRDFSKSGIERYASQNGEPTCRGAIVCASGYDAKTRGHDESIPNSLSGNTPRRYPLHEIPHSR